MRLTLRRSATVFIRSRKKTNTRFVTNWQGVHCEVFCRVCLLSSDQSAQLNSIVELSWVDGLFTPLAAVENGAVTAEWNILQFLNPISHFRTSNISVKFRNWASSYPSGACKIGGIQNMRTKWESQWEQGIVGRTLSKIPQGICQTIHIMATW